MRRKKTTVNYSSRRNTKAGDWLLSSGRASVMYRLKKSSKHHFLEHFTTGNWTTHQSTATSMFRTALIQSLRCASRTAVRSHAPIARSSIPPSYAILSSSWPSNRLRGVRSYSAPAGLSKNEVEGRIMDLLKNFDKVCVVLKLAQKTYSWMVSRLPTHPKWAQLLSPLT